MSPELQSILSAHRPQAGASAIAAGHRAWLRVTTALAESFPYLPDLLSGEVKWLGFGSIRVGQNIIGVDGVVRA